MRVSIVFAVGLVACQWCASAQESVQTAPRDTWENFANTIKTWFDDEEYDALDKLAVDFSTGAFPARLQDKNRTTFAFYSVFNIDNLDETETRKKMARIEKWAQSRPESAASRIALADAYVDLAWRARGSDFAYTVTDKGFREFEQHLNTAWNWLDEAEERNPKEIRQYTVRLNACRGLGKSIEDHYSVFKKGIALDATYVNLYDCMTWSLLPRWYGSRALVQQFAEEAVELTRDAIGEGAYFCVAQLVDSVEPEELYTSYSFDWPRIKQGGLDMAAASPYTDYYINYTARFAGRYKDRESMGELLDQIGERFDERLWTIGSFQRWKRWVDGDVPWPGPQRIHFAAQTGNVRVISECLDQGPESINYLNEFGRTPLNIAICRFELSAAFYLLNKGADPNILDDGGRTPLHELTNRLRRDFMQQPADGILDSVARLADTFIESDRTVAQKVEYMMDDSNATKLMRLMLEKGADLTIQDSYGWNPLHYAARKGATHFMEAFLEQPGAELDLRTNNSATALLLAVDNEQWDTAKLLIEAGADPDIGQHAGWTPLCASVDHGHIETVRLLLEHGADVNLADPTGWTPLHMAAMNGNADAINVLVAQPGIAIDAIGEEGRTPLHTAIRKGRPEATIALLEAGADPAIEDVHGKDAVGIALEHDQTSIAQLLAERGIAG